MDRLSTFVQRASASAVVPAGMASVSVRLVDEYQQGDENERTNSGDELGVTEEREVANSTLISKWAEWIAANTEGR